MNLLIYRDLTICLRVFTLAVAWLTNSLKVMGFLFVADLWQTTVFLTPQKEFTQKTAGVKDKNIASTTI